MLTRSDLSLPSNLLAKMSGVFRYVFISLICCKMLCADLLSSLCMLSHLLNQNKGLSSPVLSLRSGAQAKPILKGK